MKTGKLTALAVRRAVSPGRYGDGGNLHLLVRPSGSRSWVMRYQLPGGRQQDLGLGAESEVSLAQARELARKAREMIREGKDPIAVRRESAAAAVGIGTTFREVALEYVAVHEKGWKNEVHRKQWRATLEIYAFPLIGKLPVAAVEVTHVLNVLRPIWMEKPETAGRLRGRIENILGYAKVRGWRDGLNPARWKENVDRLLPARSALAAVEHHPAMPWCDCRSFLRRLEQCEGASPLALRFAILTAGRTSEVTGAPWREFDLPGRKWTIPPERMKANVEHQIPLSAGALAILAACHRPDVRPDDYVFPGGVQGRPLSNNAMLALLERLGHGNVTVHGFRSSFRDWASEMTDHPSDAVEAALAHGVRDKVEASYRRTKLYQRRIALMDDWWALLAGVVDGDIDGGRTEG